MDESPQCTIVKTIGRLAYSSKVTLFRLIKHGFSRLRPPAHVTQFYTKLAKCLNEMKGVFSRQLSILYEGGGKK
jgi:hypothetical protein